MLCAGGGTWGVRRSTDGEALAPSDRGLHGRRPPHHPHAAPQGKTPWPHRIRARRRQYGCLRYSAPAEAFLVPRFVRQRLRLPDPSRLSSRWRGSRRGCVRSPPANGRRPAIGARPASAWRCRRSAGRSSVHQTGTGCLCWPCAGGFWPCSARPVPNNPPASGVALRRR